ncbi:hypothetical protein QZM76_14060 [Burkholderia multivorans]|nr:hypothetical protein [Burkholderia multivorans]
MKIPGIEVGAVDPSWRMRTRPWLDMKTLKPVYSIEVREPEKKVWANIYTKNTGLMRFKTEQEAKAFFDGLKEKHHG